MSYRVKSPIEIIDGIRYSLLEHESDIPLSVAVEWEDLQSAWDACNNPYTMVDFLATCCQDDAIRAAVACISLMMDVHGFDPILKPGINEIMAWTRGECDAVTAFEVGTTYYEISCTTRVTGSVKGDGKLESMANLVSYASNLITSERSQYAVDFIRSIASVLDRSAIDTDDRIAKVIRGTVPVVPSVTSIIGKTIQHRSSRSLRNTRYNSPTK